MRNVTNDPAPRSDLGDRRVQACLKACEGIPTSALESNVIVRLAAACIHLKDPLVTEILEEMAPPKPRLVKK